MYAGTNPLSGSESGLTPNNFLLLLKKVIEFIIYISKLSYPILKVILAELSSRSKSGQIENTRIITGINYLQRLFDYIDSEINKKNE